VFSLIISSSILNADYLNLEKEIKSLEDSLVDSIHIDIMDGRFVEHTTWGASIITSIREVTNLPLDVHLMIDSPERNIEEYVSSGADTIFIHPESTVYLRKLLKIIKKNKIRTGVALKLDTPINVLVHCLDLVDTVLLVTCDEGFGGQPFHPLSLKKISELKKVRESNNLSFSIEVDGGINMKSGKQCKDAGAERFVLGSLIFKEPTDRSGVVHRFRNNIDSDNQKVRGDKNE